MGGHAAAEVFLNWHGWDGGRKYAFDQEGKGWGFSWVAGGKVPKMRHCTHYFMEEKNRAKSAITVQTPDGKHLPLESPELVESLAAHYPDKFHLIHLGVGVFDEFPISIISTETLKGLTTRVGFPVESNRFRPNIIIEPLEPIDAIEDQWVARTLAFVAMLDAPSVAVSQRDPRCVLVNYDRKTLKQTPEVLREIAQHRSNGTGVYGSVVNIGAIKVSDPAFLV